MIEKEKDYISTKVNAGVVQENIKFPKKYRDEINLKIMKLLGIKCNKNIFDEVHANRFFNDKSELDNIEGVDSDE